MNLGRFGSRKFWVTCISLGAFAALPIVYQSIQVDSEVQMLVLGCIAFAGGIYNGTNVLAKKYGSND